MVQAESVTLYFLVPGILQGEETVENPGGKGFVDTFALIGYVDIDIFFVRMKKNSQIFAVPA